MGMQLIEDLPDDVVGVRADGEVGFNHGDRVSLTPREDMIHRFDGRGLRIG